MTRNQNPLASTVTNSGYFLWTDIFPGRLAVDAAGIVTISRGQNNPPPASTLP